MKIFLALFILLSYSIQAKNDLAISAVFRDEARFLKEWIDYHIVVGAEHFYLYNNNSTDDFRPILQPYIEKGLVTLIEWPSEGKDPYWINFCDEVQPAAFRNAIEKAKSDQYKWLALINPDEFILPKEGDSVVEILNDFDDSVGVVVYWQKFGDNRVDYIHEDEFVIEKLTCKALVDCEINKGYKSIVRPELVKTIDNPHKAIYKNGDAINCDKSSPDIITLNKLQLNHYWIRGIYLMGYELWPRYEKYGSIPYEIPLDVCSPSQVNKIRDYGMLPFVQKIKDLRKNL